MSRITLLIVAVASFISFINVQAQSDLEPKNFGPSRGRIPQSYANQILNNLSSLDYAKFYANKAIEYFLDDDCPLPKNLVGEFKDENGNDAASMFRGNEGCNTLMLALFQLYLAHPADSECKGYLERVIRFADCLLEYGTDRYGKEHSPLLASILMRGEKPYVPTDPENPERGVRIEQRSVYSYTDNKIVSNYCAISLGNIWNDSDESHKSCWRGCDLEANNDLYTLLYLMDKELDDGDYPDKNKYKKAADASLAFWTNRCQTESNMYPWGEHAGWDFFRDRYNDDYYHAPLHEYKGGFRTNLDKLIENQARVRPGEMTSFEKYASALRDVHTGEADYGRRYNGYMLEGMFLFCRHGPLWADRKTARYQGNNQDVGGSFGCFPKHIGSYLYIMALAYNRSHDQEVRDSLAANLNFFLDGIEHQKTVYTLGKYYPYGTFNWYGYPTGSSSISSGQNGDLGIFAKRASVLMEGLDNTVCEKLLTVAKNTNAQSSYPYVPYPGPALVTSVFPQEGYCLHRKTTVDLNWQQADKAVRYRIYLSEGLKTTAEATPDSMAFIAETTDTQYTVGNLLPDKVYYWAIDAVSGSGDLTKGNIFLLKTSSEQAVQVQAVGLPSQAEMQVFDTLTLSPVFKPQNASNPYVYWTSSNEHIATVDTKGKVTAKASGSVIITASSVDEQVSTECRIQINALPQEIVFEPIPTQYLSQNNYIQLEANASSGLPVRYEVVSGPGKLQEETSCELTESAYTNSGKLSHQTLLRIHVNGMQALFQADLAGIDLSQTEQILFEYTTAHDGKHYRNYDTEVYLIAYPTGWTSGDKVPDPVSLSPVSNTIVQPKIAEESAFASTQEYLAAYQKPLQLDITEFVKNSLSDGQTRFSLGLCASKVNESDGGEYIRVASHAYPETRLRPRILCYKEGEGHTLLFTGTGDIRIKAGQAGNAVYQAANGVTQTFRVEEEASSIVGHDYTSGIRVYPNPFKEGTLHILSQQTGVVQLQIHHPDGRLIYREVSRADTKFRIDRSLFEPGFYIISILSENSKTSYKLVVE